MSKIGGQGLIRSKDAKFGRNVFFRNHTFHLTFKARRSHRGAWLCIVNSGFLFENRVAGPKVGPYILVQRTTYGSIWKLCQFLLNIWKKTSGNLLLPLYFQVDCWKVPNNEIDEHVTILECLGGKPLESSVFHRDLTSKKKALRFVESEIVFATWLDRSRVSCFFRLLCTEVLMILTREMYVMIHACSEIHQWYLSLIATRGRPRTSKSLLPFTGFSLKVWSHRNSPCLPGHILIYFGFGLLYRFRTDLAHPIIHPHVMAVMRYKYAQKGAPTNSSGTRSIRPAYPRNRKSSSAASTLSWQGPTLPGCLPSQQKSVCPKMWFQGHELGSKCGSFPEISSPNGPTAQEHDHFTFP